MKPDIKKVRWGIFGVAKIAVTRVIPAMQAGEYSEVVGIASRDRARAEAAARELGIPKAYGSYEEILELMAVRDRTGVKIGEGFMVQNHPQWRRIVELVRGGRIGQLRSAVGT